MPYQVDVARARRPWPLVQSLGGPLVELAPVLVRRVGHHGRLVLSGIHSSVEGDVDRAYRARAAGALVSLET